MKKKLKKRRKDPTPMQREAFKRIVLENGRNKGKILKEVGYSDAMATHPQKIIRSKGWNDLMEEFIPDDLLARKHNELLKAQKKITKMTKDGDVLTVEEELDTQAVKAALDMGYKLKGKYKEHNEQKQPIVNINIDRRKEIATALEDM